MGVFHILTPWGRRIYQADVNEKSLYSLKLS